MTSENAQTPHLAIDLKNAMNAENWPRVAGLLTTEWVELMSSHRDLLTEVMRSLPNDVVERSPTLAATRAYAEFIPDAGPVRPTRFQAPVAAPQALLEILSFLTARSAGARMAGNHVDAVAAATEARRALTDATPVARLAVTHVLPDICVQWAISHFLAGDLSIAYEIFTEVYDGAVTTGNTRMAAESAGNCALILALTGTEKQVREWLCRMPPVEDLTDTVEDAGRIAEAFIAIDGLDRSRAEALALDLSRSHEVEHWALRLLVQARIALLWQPDTTVALSTLLGTVSAYPTAISETGLNGGVIALAEAELRLRAGDYVRARAAITRARGAAVHDDCQYLDVVDARISALTGRRPRARSVLTDVLARDPLPRIAVSARLVRGALSDNDAEVDREAVRHLVAHSGFEAVRVLVDRASWEGTSDALRERNDEVMFSPVFSDESTDLTRRERAVLRQIVDGSTVAEIAEAEHLSPHTVKKQLLAAYRKIGVGDRAAAVDAVHAAPWVLAE